MALTGFNQDVIAEGSGATTAMTTYDVDGSNGAGYVFASASYVNPAGDTPASSATRRTPARRTTSRTGSSVTPHILPAARQSLQQRATV